VALVVRLQFGSPRRQGSDEGRACSQKVHSPGNPDEFPGAFRRLNNAEALGLDIDHGVGMGRQMFPDADPRRPDSNDVAVINS
jgi:hypothetical protein